MFEELVVLQFSVEGKKHNCLDLKSIEGQILPEVMYSVAIQVDKLTSHLHVVFIVVRASVK